VTAVFDVAHGQRAAWQRDAVARLAVILEENRQLPVISWTVCGAGGALVGRVDAVGSAGSVRASFDAWCLALALEKRTEVSGGGTTLLRAAAHHRLVRVSITATVAVDDEAGGLG
jgi:hypothetical protein